MAIQYTSQVISGYNSSPPSDDGAQTESNKITWAKHKTKLSDPIKTLAEAINTQLLTAFGTNYAANVTTKSSAFAVAFQARFSLGALVTFLVTVAGIPILNIGAPFWALIAGSLVSLVLERQDWRAAGAGRATS